MKRKPLVVIFGMTLCFALYQCKTDRKKPEASQAQSGQTQTSKRSAADIAHDVQVASASYQAQACDEANANSNPLCPVVNTLANTDTSALTSAIETMSSDPSAVTDLSKTLQDTANSNNTNSSTDTSLATGSVTNTNTNTSTNVNTSSSKKPAWSNQQIIGMSFMIAGAIIYGGHTLAYRDLREKLRLVNANEELKKILFEALNANPDNQSMVKKIEAIGKKFESKINETIYSKTAYKKALNYAQEYDKLKKKNLEHDAIKSKLNITKFLDPTRTKEQNLNELEPSIKGKRYTTLASVIIGSIIGTSGIVLYTTGLAEGTDTNPTNTYLNTLGALANEILSQN